MLLRSFNWPSSSLFKSTNVSNVLAYFYIHNCQKPESLQFHHLVIKPLPSYQENDKGSEEVEEALAKKEEKKEDPSRTSLSSSATVPLLLLLFLSSSTFCSTAAAMAGAWPDQWDRYCTWSAAVLSRSKLPKSNPVPISRNYCGNKSHLSYVTNWDYPINVPAIYSSKSCLWGACCGDAKKRELRWVLWMSY